MLHHGKTAWALRALRKNAECFPYRCHQVDEQPIVHAYSQAVSVSWAAGGGERVLHFEVTVSLKKMRGPFISCVSIMHILHAFKPGACMQMRGRGTHSWARPEHGSGVGEGRQCHRKFCLYHCCSETSWSCQWVWGCIVKSFTQSTANFHNKHMHSAHYVLLSGDNSFVKVPVEVKDGHQLCSGVVWNILERLFVWVIFSSPPAPLVSLSRSLIFQWKSQ